MHVILTSAPQPTIVEHKIYTEIWTVTSFILYRHRHLIIASTTLRKIFMLVTLLCAAYHQKNPYYKVTFCAWEWEFCLQLLIANKATTQRVVQVLKETYGYLYVHVHPFSQMNIKQTKEFFLLVWLLLRMLTSYCKLHTAIMKYALVLLYMTLFILFSVNF